MSNYSGPDRRRSDRRHPTGVLDLAEAAGGIADRAAEREREACAKRIEAWGIGLTTDVERRTAAEAARVVRSGA